MTAIGPAKTWLTPHRPTASDGNSHQKVGASPESPGGRFSVTLEVTSRVSSRVTVDASEKVAERRIRRALHRRGLILMRSRARDPAALGYGGYQIADLDGAIVAGPGFTLSLAETEEWLDRPTAPSPPPSMNIVVGHCLDRLRTLPADHFHCCVTSPPYWFVRDNGHKRQIGLEPTPNDYVGKLVEVFREVRRVLRPDGTLWVNVGDSYLTRRAIRQDGKRSVSRDIEHQRNTQPSWREASANGKALHTSRLRHTGVKEKDLLLLPFMLAMALREDGWYLRANIVWAKTRTAPDPASDRPSRAHEALFMLSPEPTYFYDGEALMEESADGQRRWGRDVWTISPSPGRGNHTSTMPLELAQRCIQAGSPAGGYVIDPFGGVGTTAVAARDCGRSATIIEINRAYAKLAKERLKDAR